jgi:hypothetical protein
MSDINGNGYGSSHKWKKAYTNEYPIGAGDKFSVYQCENCGYKFKHFYDIHSNIFYQIEINGIPDICPKL